MEDERSTLTIKELIKKEDSIGECEERRREKKKSGGGGED